MESIVLGGGCFWCLEATYQLIRGVVSVVPGYGGGSSDNPDYWSVHDDKNGHAEVVQVTFDPSIIILNEILDIFWVIHDPTTQDKQGNDVGPEYRSIILYMGKQKPVIDVSLNNAQKLWDNPIVTEANKLDKFYEAEPEHHNYFVNHPEQAYCQVIINTKLAKLRNRFADKLK